MTMSSTRGTSERARTHRRRRRLGATVPNFGQAVEGRVPAKNASEQGNKHQSKNHPDDTYKTEMCNNWIEFGKCRYNQKCRFAHGEHELRVARRIASEKKWKSEYCRNYHTEGTCSYGRRCHFIHDETEEELRRMHETQKRVGGWRREGKTNIVRGSANLIKNQSPTANALVVSPSADSTLESRVAALNLTGGKILSSRSENVSQQPIPLKRRNSLHEFCKEFGLPTADDENSKSSSMLLSDSPIGEPFLCRNSSSFSHLQGKQTFKQKGAEPALIDSTCRLPRLAVFQRIASDTGVVISPPSPMTIAP